VLAGLGLAAEDDERDAAARDRLAHFRRIRRGRDDRLRLAVPESVGERVRPEERRQRQGDGAHAEEAHVDDTRLERLGVDDPDDITAPDPERH
jgi:hypothetical protein